MLVLLLNLKDVLQEKDGKKVFSYISMSHEHPSKTFRWKGFVVSQVYNCALIPLYCISTHRPFGNLDPHSVRWEDPLETLYSVKDAIQNDSRFL